MILKYIYLKVKDPIYFINMLSPFKNINNKELKYERL